jgi:CelD/BcsL family acetyltransferase involved in cellulose biosynthesis
MKITAIPAEQLTAEHVRCWDEIQRSDRALESPFFRPEFTQAVAAVRSGVFAGIMEEAGRVVGFFPFQRRGWRLGCPVGAPMSDYHGVIARPETRWTPAELLHGCGLRGWDFDHVPARQEPFRAYHRILSESPYIDLEDGFERYAEDRQRAGSANVKDTLRRIRKAERELGVVRLEAQVRADQADGVFETLRQWKSMQYRETMIADPFTFTWPVLLLQRILGKRSDAFSGMLSALYFGDRLAAVHLGMCSYGVLHYWFPAYDPGLAKYSPGMALVIELARASASLGLRRIDLGKGSAAWKTSLKSGGVPLAEGCCSRSTVVRLARDGISHAKAWARTSRFGAPVRALAQRTRTFRAWFRFQ